MVTDADAVWKQLRERNVAPLHSIANRDYRLRDFTVMGPEGIAIRFASRIPGFEEY